MTSPYGRGIWMVGVAVGIVASLSLVLRSLGL